MTFTDNGERGKGSIHGGPPNPTCPASQRRATRIARHLKLQRYLRPTAVLLDAATRGWQCPRPPPHAGIQRHPLWKLAAQGIPSAPRPPKTSILCHSSPNHHLKIPSPQLHIPSKGSPFWRWVTEILLGISPHVLPAPLRTWVRGCLAEVRGAFPGVTIPTSTVCDHRDSQSPIIRWVMTLTGHQVPTKATQSLPSSAGQGAKNITKTSRVGIRTGGSLSS